MKFAVVGCGSIGQRHIRNLLSLGETELVAVDSDVEKLNRFSNEFKIKTAPDLDQVLSTGCDVVFITAPTSFHIDIAMKSAKAGCHIFLEKPLSHNKDGVDALIEEIDKRNLVAMMGSNWKFYPLFKKMKELIDLESIGKITSARCQFGQYLPDWHPYEDYRNGYSANQSLGGGILLDSHEFDYLTWFLGDVNKLASFSGKVSDLDIDVEDTAEIILQFANGSIGEIHLDYTQRKYQRSFEFYGTEGTIWWDFSKKSVVLYSAKEATSYEWMEPKNYDLNDMYIEQTKHFLKCLKEKIKPVTPLSQGRKILELILAAKESNQHDKVIRFN